MTLIYSRRLAGPVSVSATATVVYTVPSGVVAVIKSFGGYLTGPNADRITLGIGLAPNGTTAVGWYEKLLEQGKPWLENCSLALVAGDRIRVNHTGAGSGMRFWASGYELAEVP